MEDSASASCFPDFPILSVDELQIIALGCYQPDLAKRYAKLHMKNSGDFDIKVNNEFPGVVRAKIESRFISNKTHDLWIQYDSTKSGVQAITGYYCCCKQGSRVVGCCAHISCVCTFITDFL